MHSAESALPLVMELVLETSAVYPLEESWVSAASMWSGLPVSTWWCGPVPGILLGPPQQGHRKHIQECVTHWAHMWPSSTALPLRPVRNVITTLHHLLWPQWMAWPLLKPKTKAAFQSVTPAAMAFWCPGEFWLLACIRWAPTGAVLWISVSLTCTSFYLHLWGAAEQAVLSSWSFCCSRKIAKSQHDYDAKQTMVTAGGWESPG